MASSTFPFCARRIFSDDPPVISIFAERLGIFLLMISDIAVPIMENAPPELEVAMEIYFLSPESAFASAEDSCPPAVVLPALLLPDEPHPATAAAIQIAIARLAAFFMFFLISLSSVC